MLRFRPAGGPEVSASSRSSRGVNCRAFSVFPQVTAIAQAGSEGAGEADALSDIDLYVYADAEIPIQARRAIAGDFADRVEIDNRFWEPGDEWIDRASGRSIDIMYRSPAWIQAQLARVLERHEASIGVFNLFLVECPALACAVRSHGLVHQSAADRAPAISGGVAARNRRQELPDPTRQHFLVPAPGRGSHRARRLGQHAPPRECFPGQLLGH